MAQIIPEGSVEIQTGLWMHEEQRTIAGRVYTLRKLYSAEGYCFWQVSQPENYDEEGNLKPESERVYAQYAGLSASMGLWTYEQLNAEFISVPVQDDYEIVSVPNSNVTI